MANPYRGGTPDRYYEGPGAELWVEYKYYPKLPPRIDLTDLSARTNLSRLQMTWLKRAYNNGRNVAVILGWPQGGIVFKDMTWVNPISRSDAISQTLVRKHIARWIAGQVGINETG